VCKEVAPKRRKTALHAIASLANIAQIPTRIPTSKPLAVYAAAEAAVCAEAPAKTKVSPPDRLPEQLHIPIIQHAVRAIFWRVTRKASVRENLPPRDRHYTGRDFQGGESRPVAFLKKPLAVSRCPPSTDN